MSVLFKWDQMQIFLPFFIDTFVMFLLFNRSCKLQPVAFQILQHIIYEAKVCIISCHILLQELFSKQKGFLEEELDYRKQALDQAYMVQSLEQGVAT